MNGRTGESSASYSYAQLELQLAAGVPEYIAPEPAVPVTLLFTDNGLVGYGMVMAPAE